MSPVKKVIRIFIIYLITGAVLVLNTGDLKTVASVGPSRLSLIPLKIGPWEGEDLQDKNASEIFILTDTSSFRHLVRLYRRIGEEQVVVLSALEDLKGTQRDIHDPRLCYESRGWTVLSYGDLLISTDTYNFGKTKRISYTNKTASIRRMEIFGYLAGGEMIISETALRLTHIQNRLMRIIGMKPGNVIYMNVSTDIKERDEKSRLKDLEFIMEEVLTSVMNLEA